MPQLDQLTYVTQFLWSCLFFLTFYILIIYKMEGNQQNSIIPSASSPSSSSSASGDPEKERARLVKAYDYFYKSLIQEVQAEAGLLLKRKLSLRTVSGLVLKRSQRQC
uniref:ATP synthase YMF19-like N-terminal domain-containing protein n=1 Tax=Beta macrocarpa TaxID=343494 RepID=G2XLZ1_BETMA|nr:hypothetical protein LKY79_mgp029 [Beta macrocarpa]CBX24981.1 hypothetical protein [Beta macrocarpa]